MAVVMSLAVGALCAACARSGGERGLDTVPASRDVQIVGASPSETAAGYAYIARRPLAVVALAEARGIGPELAHAAIDRVADALDACATDEGRKGLLTDGAARVVAQIDDDGNVAATSVHIDAGSGRAENAVVCFVAPVRRLVFPSADASARGIAIEAIWGHVVPLR